MKKPCPYDEQETIINVFPSIVSKIAEVYTCIPCTIQRLTKLKQQYPDEVTLVEKDDGVEAQVPSEWIRISPKRRSFMTEEQRQAKAELMKALNAAKKEVL